MDIREYLQTKEKGFYEILCNSMTVERQKQFYDAINNWHESELKSLGIADVSGSVIITEETILQIGFVKHLEYTYKIFLNNAFGYLDEIEVFFEPNEEISIIIKQKTFVSKDLDENYIFIRNMKYISELKLLIKALSGSTDR